MSLWDYFSGNWLVVYSDGKRSTPMKKSTAQSYANMFGGTIEKTDKPITWLGGKL